MNFGLLAAMAVLLFCSHPFYVAGLVVANISETAQRHSLLPSTHVQQKVLEYFPSFANFDADGTIPIESAICGILATCRHGEPRIVFWSSLSIQTMPVSSDLVSSPFANFTRRFFLKTATTFGVSVPNVVSTNNDCPSTVALAGPSTVTCILDYQESVKFESKHWRNGHGGILPEAFKKAKK